MLAGPLPCQLPQEQDTVAADSAKHRGLETSIFWYLTIEKSILLAKRLVKGKTDSSIKRVGRR